MRILVACGAFFLAWMHAGQLLAQQYNFPAGTNVQGMQFPPGSSVTVGGITMQAGTLQLQAPAGTPVDAAIGGASNQNNQGLTIRQMPRDEDFIRSMGIQVHSTGVGMPADFSQGGRITIYGAKPGEASSDAPAKPGDADYKATSTGEKVAPGGGEKVKPTETAVAKPGDSKGDASPGAEKPASDRSQGTEPARGTGRPEKPLAKSDPTPPAHPTPGRTPPTADPTPARTPPASPTPITPAPRGPRPQLAAEPAPGTPVGDDDSVATRMTRGFEKDPGSARPMDTRIQGDGIATPKCMTESREGVDC